MRLSKGMLLCCLSLILFTGCKDRSQNLHPLSAEKAAPPPSKHVVLLVLDSFMDKPLREAIDKGDAPALAFLMQHGAYFPNLVSAFPTMSVTIDSTLLTGTYPDQHHVPGLVWFDGQQKRIVNYGNSPREALKLGPVQMISDALVQLNQVHLNPNTKTIHEQLAENGRSSASINALIYRGKTKHTLTIPESAASVTSLPKQLPVMAPQWFSFGALSQLSPANQRNTYAWNRYGFNNKFSAEELKFLIREGKLPDFTIAYFPSNDTTVHNKGPDALSGIREADRQLQGILNTYGSWEESLKNNVWVVMGDSGQTYIGKDRKQAVVRVNELLGSYKIANLNRPITEQDQIVTCVNERMAYVYSLTPDLLLSELAGHLRKEERIDVIAWKENDHIRVMSGGKDRVLTFRPGGNYRDSYGQTWSVQGDSSILDLSVNDADSRIEYGAYPDALQRLHSSLHSHAGNFVVVTAKPGYELVGESSPTHLGGGGHGSLHQQDSHVPLIIAGTESKPKYLRIVDLKEWLMGL